NVGRLSRSTTQFVALVSNIRPSHRRASDAREKERRMPPSTRAPRVLIIVQNLPVPLDRRVWMECQALVAAGYGVSVICPRGERPEDSAKFEELEGVQIYRYRGAPQARGALA